MGWDHGYFSASAYTAHFYREMAPNWLDFSALLKGHRPPRHREGESFRYLDLGCGMGFGLCLLAALYPEGEFVGVDFQPDHIAHGEGLAQGLALPNVCFLEADFLDLARDPSPLGFHSGSRGPFHYVVAHGIATWVVEPVQAALFALASRALQPGGLFYCSYNTLPGWLHRVSLHHLIQLERRRCDALDPALAIRRATSTLGVLAGDSPSGDPAILLRALPQLGDALASLKRHDTRYLAQEYANDGWQPLFVAEMQERCRRHKLSPVGTANLPELFPQLLPEPVRSVVLAEANPLLRETLADLGTMQSFRRDLFAKGVAVLNALDREDRLAEVRIRLLPSTPGPRPAIESHYGTYSLDEELTARLEVALLDGPLTLGAWSQSAALTIEELLPTAALLMHGNRIGLDRGSAGEKAAASCRVVNGRLLEMVARGRPYAHLAAPWIGNAVGVDPIKAMLVQGLTQGLEGEILLVCIQAGIESLGGTLNGPDGAPVTDPDIQIELLLAAQVGVENEFLPLLHQLGSIA